jgi:hypothetical protein
MTYAFAEFLRVAALVCRNSGALHVLFVPLHVAVMNCTIKQFALLMQVLQEIIRRVHLLCISECVKSESLE